MKLFKNIYDYLVGIGNRFIYQEAEPKAPPPPEKGGEDLLAGLGSPEILVEDAKKAAKERTEKMEEDLLAMDVSQAGKKREETPSAEEVTDKARKEAGLLTSEEAVEFAMGGKRPGKEEKVTPEAEYKFAEEKVERVEGRPGGVEETIAQGKERRDALVQRILEPREKALKAEGREGMKGVYDVAADIAGELKAEYEADAGSTLLKYGFSPDADISSSEDFVSAMFRTEEFRDGIRDDGTAAKTAIARAFPAETEGVTLEEAEKIAGELEKSDPRAAEIFASIRDLPDINAVNNWLRDAKIEGYDENNVADAMREIKGYVDMNLDMTKPENKRIVAKAIAYGLRHPRATI